MVDIVGFANSAPTASTLTYNGRMLRQMNGVGMAGATAARPLGSRSGVRPGTSITTVTASATTWTAGPFAGCADVMLAAESGAYTFSFDAPATGAVTAANASFPRRDAIFVQVVDPEDGTTTPSAVRGYLAGTVNSGGTLVIAAVPAGAFVIAEINVPIAGGGAPTVTWLNKIAVGAGGILPIRTLDFPASPSIGQYVDDAGLGLQRWTGSVWQGVTAFAVSTMGADGNATIIASALQRSPSGVVSGYWQQNRINATTYAVNLIVGVLPLGFRPVQEMVVNALTYGSGSPALCIIATTGIVTLTAASPAGHTAARITLPPFIAA